MSKNNRKISHVRVRYLLNATNSRFLTTLSIKQLPTKIEDWDDDTNEDFIVYCSSLDTLLIDGVYHDVLGLPEVVEGDNIYRLYDDGTAHRILKQVEKIYIDVTMVNGKKTTWKYECPTDLEQRVRYIVELDKDVNKRLRELDKD